LCFGRRALRRPFFAGVKSSFSVGASLLAKLLGFELAVIPFRELAEALVSPCWASPFWQSPQKEPKSLAPASGSRCAHSIAAPRVAAQGPSLALHGSRGIHAARPSAQRFHSAFWKGHSVSSYRMCAGRAERHRFRPRGASGFRVDHGGKCFAVLHPTTLSLFQNFQTTRYRVPFRRPSVGVA
jgi:hypothetical protein